MNNKSTIYGFCLVSLFIIIGAWSLIYNLEPLFDTVEKNIEDGQTIVMNGDIDSSKLENLLIEGGYVSDTKDAKFIADWYASHISERTDKLKNLGAINSSDICIPIDSALQYGGEEIQIRALQSIENAGQTEEWRSIDSSNLSNKFESEGSPNKLISVVVNEDLAKGKSKHQKLSPVSGVTVRITEHWADSIPVENLNVSHQSRILGYAVTDETGTAIFSVPAGHYYSVLPIADGYSYGKEKGTVKDSLISDLTFKFLQEPHKLKPLKGTTYNQLKSDKTLISRTPTEFKGALKFCVILFIACWACVFLVTNFLDKKSSGRSDTLLLLVLMILSGIGLLVQFSQMLPLTDTFEAYKSGLILPVGCLLLLLLSSIDYLRLFQRYRNWFGRKADIVSSQISSIAMGIPFLILAVILMFMLALFGSGPAGSDAKVNLGFFQPSEVVKYLVLMFLVCFFVAKGDTIKTFGEKWTRLARRRYLAVISLTLLGIVLVSFLFLALLKDMGPGIVILATFILMYSVVRRDTPQLLLGIVSYIIIVGAAYILSESLEVRVAAIILWLVLWVIYGYLKQRTFYESAFFFNALVTLFLLGGHLLKEILPNMAIRLFNRTGMVWSGIFDNGIPQGDQIAQGLWGVSSGRFSGMGLGGGSSYFIPAGHTDLILSSLGEQMGWLGILLIVVCFFILITRTTTAAQYSGHKFTMFLCLGIGLLTGVQFLFIALGSVGAIPLSGVPVPLLSCSRTGLVMTLAAYGVVISISRHRGSDEALKSFVVNERRQKDDYNNIEAKSLRRNLFGGMALFFVGLVCVVAINGYYQLIASNKTQIRPAITANENGLLVLEYNPRIRQILNVLDRGNIYDRNGLLLATSDKEELKNFKTIIDSLNLSVPDFDNLQRQRLKRYYPFGNHMTFMVGDLNNQGVYVNYDNVPMGYLAENENANVLRGFDTNPQTVELVSDKYKFHRFLAPVKGVKTKFKKHDYSELFPALAMSIYRNPWIERFKEERHKRDLRLTIDASLQTRLQCAMAEYIQRNPQLKSLPYLRASVVVLDAQKGDLLTSANYPLPETDSIIKLRETDYFTKSGAPSEWRKGKPITERDLGLTYQTAPGSTAKVMTALAGFKKLNGAAYDRAFEIQPYMTVEPPNREPNTSTPSMNRNGGRKTYLENAIKYSSNCYFVMLLNEEDLYTPLGEIYWNVGVSVAHNHPYFFYMNEMTTAGKSNFDNTINRFQTFGLRDYSKYMARTPKSQTWTRDSRKDRMSSIQAYTGIAWGQSQLDASPLNMARIVSIVTNDGKLTPTRYVLDDNREADISIVTSESVRLLASAMEGEASKWIDRNIFPAKYAGQIGGKTGTPMRALKGKKIQNDGWYICFIKNPQSGQTLSIAIRLERLPHGIVSTEAVKFMADVVIPVLQGSRYIN